MLAPKICANTSKIARFSQDATMLLKKIGLQEGCCGETKSQVVEH
jgi:hypothetical protein